MNNKRAPNASILVGLFVTFVVLMQLVFQIMQGAQISFERFIANPQNIVFSLYFSCLVLCAWLIKGHNNKIVLTIWALLHPIYYLIYFLGQTSFLDEQRNIYAFSWVATVGVVPLWLVFNHRKLFTLYLCTGLQRLGILKSWSNMALEQLRTTLFESRLRQFVAAWIAYEFIFAFYLVTYALLMQVPAAGSIAGTMREHGHFIPFPYYPIGSIILTLWLMLIIATNTFKDLNTPDDDNFTLTKESKAKLKAKFGNKNPKN